MFKKKTSDDPYPHVKYTKYGNPYVDVNEILGGEVGKDLHNRMEKIRNSQKKILKSEDEKGS